MVYCFDLRFLIRDRPESMNPSRGEGGGGSAKRYPFVKFFDFPLHFASRGKRVREGKDDVNILYGRPYALQPIVRL